MKMKALASLFLALGFAAPLAQAASETFTVDTGAYQKTDFTSPLSFTAFNPSLGTLTQVDVLETGSINTTLTVSNTGSSSSHGSVFTAAQFNFQASNPIIDSFVNTNPSIDISTASQHFTLSPGHSLTLTPTVASGTYAPSSTDANVLAAFSGTSPLSLTVWTLTQTGNIYSGGNTLASQTTYGQGAFQVTYYYTPSTVPVPAAIWLVGSALAGLVGFGRRKLPV